MPIIEHDPWRMQYFEGIECPASVLIPTDDQDGYRLYPAHRWLYNKLLIAETQGLACAPHGIAPEAYPVFSKPIYNLRGMGAGSRLLESAAAYEAWQQPGHMWMERLTGEHVSSDVAVVEGRASWWRHTIGKAGDEGTFDYWTVLAEPRSEIEAYAGAWLRRHLADYTGMVNVETIGGRMIEAHLRFADQWPDLYGPGWLEAMVALYAQKRWQFDYTPQADGYSVVLFGAHGYRYAHPPLDMIDGLCARSSISSIQVTFHAHKRPEAHAMPPGGFRLAVINCHDVQQGMLARCELERHFTASRQAMGEAACAPH